jgi:hypothetical protein
MDGVFGDGEDGYMQVCNTLLTVIKDFKKGD